MLTGDVKTNPVPSLIEGATTNCKAEDELPFEARTNLYEVKICMYIK